MTEIFDKEFRNLFRNIYQSGNDGIIYNVMSFLNYVITNEEIISNHKYKDNIKKIIDKELEKISEIKKLHKLYFDKITNIFYNVEYDIL
jgi:hypothetical protein